MSYGVQQQLNGLIQQARAQARGTYAQRIRQYEWFKRQLDWMDLSSSEYAFWIRKLANALKV